MRPVSLRPALILAVATILTACGGSGSPAATPGSVASDGQGDTGAGAPSEAAPAPGGNVEVPTVAEALYQSGTAHIEVSGGRQLTADAALVPGASMGLSDGTMLAIYQFGEGQEVGTFSVSINPDTGPAVTLQAPNIITGGDSATGCAIEFTKSDATGVAGTFRCANIDSLTTLDVTKIDMSGSFSAAP